MGQDPKYQEAEGVDTGYSIAVIYSDKDLRKLSDIQGRASKVNRATGAQLGNVENVTSVAIY